MRPDMHLAYGLDEISRIIRLIRTHTQGATSRSLPAISPLAVEHQQGRVSLGGAVGLRQHRIHNDSVAVLHQNMTQIAKPGFLSVPFPVEARLWIGLRFMRLVAAPLAAKL